jgi:LysM repeat protein
MAIGNSVATDRAANAFDNAEFSAVVRSPLTTDLPKKASLDSGASTGQGSNFAGDLSNPFDDARLYAGGGLTINGMPTVSGFGATDVKAVTMETNSATLNISTNLSGDWQPLSVNENLPVAMPSHEDLLQANMGMGESMTLVFNPGQLAQTASIISAFAAPVSESDLNTQLLAYSRSSENLVFNGKTYLWKPYTVKSGDNLSTISLTTLGDAYAYDIIAQHNGIPNANLIQIGAQIEIPELTTTIVKPPNNPSGGFSYGGKKYTWTPYIVQVGDTLSGLALATLGNGSAYNVIAEHNSIPDSNLIRTGQRIEIPTLGTIAPGEIKVTPISPGVFTYNGNSYIWIAYTIKSGDTLSQLALDNIGDAGGYKLIAEHNQIPNPNDIKVGRRIEIPRIASVVPEVSFSIYNKQDQIGTLVESIQPGNGGQNLSNLKNRIDDLKNGVKDLGNKTKDLQNTVGQYDSLIDEKRKKGDAINSRINEINKQLDAKQKEIADLLPWLSIPWLPIYSVALGLYIIKLDEASKIRSELGNYRSQKEQNSFEIQSDESKKAEVQKVISNLQEDLAQQQKDLDQILPGYYLNSNLIDFTQEHWDMLGGESAQYGPHASFSDGDQTTETIPSTLLNVYEDLSKTIFGTAKTVTTGYAYDKGYYNSLSQAHSGLDIDSNNYSDNIRSAINGKISFIDNQGTNGYWVAIDEFEKGELTGRRWWFGHLDKPIIELGKTVTVGATIAKAGGLFHLHLLVVDTYKAVVSAEETLNGKKKGLYNDDVRDVLSRTMNPLQAFWKSKNHIREDMPKNDRSV